MLKLSSSMLNHCLWCAYLYAFACFDLIKLYLFKATYFVGSKKPDSNAQNPVAENKENLNPLSGGRFYQFQ